MTTNPTQLPHFELIEMQHDGNCMFRCISYALYGRQGNFPEVKVRINSYVLRNWNRFGEFAVDSNGDKFLSKTAYKRFAGKSDRFGDFCDLVAASELFHCPITVYRGQERTYIGQGKGAKPIHLALSGVRDEGRYDYLELKVCEVHRCRSYAEVAKEPATPAAVACSSPSAFAFVRACSVRAKKSGGVQGSLADNNRNGGMTANKTHYTQGNSSARDSNKQTEKSTTKHQYRNKTSTLHKNGNYKNSEFIIPTQNRFQVLTKTLEEGNTVAITLQKHRGKIGIEVRKAVKAKTQEKHSPRRSGKTADRGTNKITKTVKSENYNDRSALSFVDSPKIGQNETHEMISLIDISIGEKILEALVDTGAAVNCIQYDILMSADPRAKIAKTEKVLKAANNQAFKTYGEWNGKFTIGNLSFSSKFYVCKGISSKIILGNTFLRSSQAVVDYAKKKISFKNEGKLTVVEFGVFYKPINSIFNIFQDMDVESLYSGPQFLRSKSTISIPPKTIKYIKVTVTPHKLEKDTVFIGNPSLKKRYNLIVSDFILSQAGTKIIQVINIDSEPHVINPSLNLAVDEEHLDTFFGSEISGISSGKIPKFNINPKLTQTQRDQAETLLEQFRDVFALDVSQLTKCKYPPIRIGYDESKIVRQRNYRMSPDEKEFAEGHIQKLLDADLVEQCTSVYCTPILVVPKVSADPNIKAYRLVQDFRKINKIISDIRYPIPDQQELIDSFFGKYWHSVTDNCSGYTQLGIHPSCRDITAFDSPAGSRLRWKTLPQEENCQLF